MACFHGDELAFPESTTVVGDSTMLRMVLTRLSSCGTEAKLGEYGYMLNIQFFRT